MKKFKLKRGNQDRYGSAWEEDVNNYIKINRNANIIFYKDDIVGIETITGIISLTRETMDKIVASYIANKLSWNQNE